MSSNWGARHRREIAAGGEAPDRAAETILVAEDEPAVRALVVEVLRRHGYDVLEAVDGAAALELAALHGGPIHLLLTDIDMPRLNGQELHRKLRAERPETRTLFMSGLPPTELRSVAPFLAKPFRAHVLVRKLQEVLHDPGGRGAQR